MTDTNLARETTLSIAWAVFALGLIVAGFMRRYAPLRWVDIAIFGYTVGRSPSWTSRSSSASTAS